MSNVNKVNRLYSINVKLHRAVSQSRAENKSKQYQIDQLEADKAALIVALKSSIVGLSCSNDTLRVEYKALAKRAIAATEDK